MKHPTVNKIFVYWYIDTHRYIGCQGVSDCQGWHLDTLCLTKSPTGCHGLSGGVMNCQVVSWTVRLLGEAVGLLEVLLDRYANNTQQKPVRSGSWETAWSSGSGSPGHHPTKSPCITWASPCITWASPHKITCHHLPSPAITCHHLTITLHLGQDRCFTTGSHVVEQRLTVADSTLHFYQ